MLHPFSCRPFASCRGLGLAALLSCLAACSWLADDWQAAVRDDTPEAYENFLKAHPGSQHATAARVRREALLDERDWQAARGADTPEAYGHYVAVHPQGLWSELANRRRAPPAENPEPEPATPPQSAPPPIEEARETAAPAAPVAHHFAQLGSYSSEALALRSWRRLQAAHAQLGPLQPVITRVPQSGTSLYRLRVGLPSRSEASALCAALVGAGAECIAPPPP
jgi:hypothetical protein